MKIQKSNRTWVYKRSWSYLGLVVDLVGGQLIIQIHFTTYACNSVPV